MPPPMHRFQFPATGYAIGGLLALILILPARGQDPSTPVPPQNRTAITNVTFVAFDTETTGFDPVKDRVVEIGAVKFRGGKVLEQKSWLINPGREIPYWARRVHGITDEMVEDQPRFKDVYGEFSAFISGSVLMAHNARFDVAFINQETLRNQLAPPVNDVVDTLALFRAWFPESEKFSLEGLATHLDIQSGAFHRAVADSMYIYWILETGLKKRGPAETLGMMKKSAGGTLRF